MFIGSYSVSIHNGLQCISYQVLDVESLGTRKPNLRLTPAQWFEIGKKVAVIGATSAMYYFAKIYTNLPLTGQQLGD